MNNLGLAYEGLGRFEEAIACYDRALPIKREVGDRHGEGTTLNNLGIVYRQLRRFEDAVGVLQDGLVAVREAGGGFLEAEVLRELGLVRRDQGDRVGARGWWGEALTVLARFSDTVAREEAETVRGLLADLDGPRL